MPQGRWFLNSDWSERRGFVSLGPFFRTRLFLRPTFSHNVMQRIINSWRPCGLFRHHALTSVILDSLVRVPTPWEIQVQTHACTHAFLRAAATTLPLLLSDSSVIYVWLTDSCDRKSHPSGPGPFSLHLAFTPRVRQIKRRRAEGGISVILNRGWYKKAKASSEKWHANICGAGRWRMTSAVTYSINHVEKVTAT